MMYIKLLPCPFCGNTVTMCEPYPEYDDKKGITYGCMIRHNCEGGFKLLFGIKGYSSKMAARKGLATKWNKRKGILT